MLREAAREEVRKVAGPLFLLLKAALNSGDFDRFNIARSAVCSIVAHLAYCAIGADEKERRNRAKVVPCLLFQELLAAEDFDFVEAVRSLDIDVDVVRTRKFVAIIVYYSELFLIGVRETQLAYDWLINLNVGKDIDRTGGRFHRGFLQEADELEVALQKRLHSRNWNRVNFRKCRIWFAGHSLGGAIAAILNHHWNWLFPVEACLHIRVTTDSKIAGMLAPISTFRNSQKW